MRDFSHSHSLLLNLTMKQQILDNLQSLSYQELETVERRAREIKNSKLSEYLDFLRDKNRKNKAKSDRAKEKFERIKPFIVEWLYLNMKPGDIITCKGYNGFKKVTEKNGDQSVYAMCGNFRHGNFVPNGYGSETMMLHVTSILRDGRFQKIVDLIKM